MSSTNLLYPFDYGAAVAAIAVIIVAMQYVSKKNDRGKKRHNNAMCMVLYNKCGFGVFVNFYVLFVATQ